MRLFTSIRCFFENVLSLAVRGVVNLNCATKCALEKTVSTSTDPSHMEVVVRSPQGNL